MNAIRTLAGLAALATVATATLVQTATPAHAANRFAVACVLNKTNVPIFYQIRWADVGVWETFQLEPGQNRWFAHRYTVQNEGRSPQLLIRFDSDLSHRRFNIQYNLTRRSAPAEGCDGAAQYNFRQEGGGKYIDLKRAT